MWYTDSYRRHLCDMHIDDWSDEFLSEFDPDEYFANLKRANVQNAMLYFQSHVGLCYYPTKSGKMHNTFRDKEDMMKRLAEKCRSHGITVTGYYSLIYNNWAHDNFPQWRLVGPNGKSAKESSLELSAEFSQRAVCRYGMCCPNNKDYRGFVAEQIKEMSEYFEFDGMFFDMLFWPTPCYCESCRKRWADEVGGELLEVTDPNHPMWQMHMEKRRQWMGEFAQFATDTLKEYAPHSSVEHNIASAAVYRERGGAEEVVLASDFAGGDLYGGIYNQSFACKLYRNITQNQPFDYMTSRCTPTLAKHTTSKSEDTLESEVFLTAAHHGATLMIDAIDPVGTLDSRIYDMFGRIYTRHMDYEKYFYGEMVEDVGLYYSLRSKIDLHGEGYTNHNSCVRAVKTMIHHNICCGVASSMNSLDGYQILIAPSLTDADSRDYQRIIEYVSNGGQLYLSGGDCGQMLKEFFGATVTGRTEHKVVYVAPNENAREAFGYFNEKYPLHVDGTAPITKGIAPEKVIATIKTPYTVQGLTKFASIHSDPPGILTQIPAVAVTDYGKGRVVWSGLNLECIENYNHSQVVLNLLNTFFTLKKSFCSDAPRDVEVTMFKAPGHYLVNTVLLNDDQQARRVEPFVVSVRCDGLPKNVVHLPEETPVDFWWHEGYATWEVSNLDIFSMFKINL